MIMLEFCKGFIFNLIDPYLTLFALEHERSLIYLGILCVRENLTKSRQISNSDWII